jgi:hypothetical protein
MGKVGKNQFQILPKNKIFDRLLNGGKDKYLKRG